MTPRLKLALWGTLAIAGLGAITPGGDKVTFCAPCFEDQSGAAGTTFISLGNDAGQRCLLDPKASKTPEATPEIPRHAVDL